MTGGSNPLDVTLVLDVSGSMASSMDDRYVPAYGPFGTGRSAYIQSPYDPGTYELLDYETDDDGTRGFYIYGNAAISDEALRNRAGIVTYETTSQIASDYSTDTARLKAGGNTIYSIGVFSKADAGDLDLFENKFMQAVSSNYPKAVRTANNEWILRPRAEGDYYLTASDSGQLQKIFQDIWTAISSKPTSPIASTTTESGVERGTVTFTDTLGDYMAVRAFKSVIFAGRQFDKKSVTTADGAVSFTSNAYEPNAKLGSTTATFTPAQSNAFYYFTEDTSLYNSKNTADPAKSVDANGTYYYQRTYYAALGVPGTPIAGKHTCGVGRQPVQHGGYARNHACDYRTIQADAAHHTARRNTADDRPHERGDVLAVGIHRRD
ncbi:hypothetical protein [Bifidobacterium pseudolongum]|uniref:Uncharacterized protein n=1 Tax=Bifidobacterium pseudolongum subsp. globosum TaxID=1690 RepID=A0A2N3R6U1_9BIFI|nr:hypothetical protein [Bifidobacterium pseudolongum]PKV05073.1 hypothetical protein CQR50_0327 [Bifidobacterium pseudolongum subsp. globosum]